MKKNWLQIVILCSCIVLLVVTIGQSRKLNEYQRQTENRIDDLSRSLNMEIQNISGSIARELEEANRTVLGYVLEPTGMDQENHALLADMSVTLKEWYENTDVTLLAEVGEENISLSMIPDGNGTFVGQLSLPLEKNYEISFGVLISAGERTKRENLGSWGEMYMLLPLRNGGGGWSGPEYQGGVMRSRFSITIESQTDSVQNPTFQIYKNGELTQTLTAVVDPYTSASNGICYTVDTEGYIWSLKCNVGDVIDIHFCCEDEYGLGYDFLFQTWSVEDETVENPNSAGVQSSGGYPTLYWTK